MKNTKILLTIALLLVACLLVGCGNNTKNKDKEKTYTLPWITNETEAVGSVTKADVYKMVRYYGNVDLLIEKIDSELLKDEVAKVTTDEINDIIEEMVFGSYEAIEREALTDDEEDEIYDDFYNTLYMMGYRTEQQQENYFKVNAAKKNYAKAYLNEHKDDKRGSYAINDTILESFYNNKNDDTAKAIVISYSSIEEFFEALETKNVIVYNSELRSCDDITALPSKRNYDEVIEATTALEASEVKSLFVELFNDRYGSYLETIDASNLDSSEYCTFSYDTLTKSANSICNKLFALNQDEYTYTVSKGTTNAGVLFTVIYRLDGTEKTPFNELTADAVDALKVEYLESQLTTATIATIINELRKENNLCFYDKELAYNYSANYDSTYDYANVECDGNKVVSYADVTMTADDYYDYAISNNKEYYLLNASINELSKTLSLYNKVYGENVKDSLRYKANLEAFNKTLESQEYDNLAEHLYQNTGFNNIDDVMEYNYVQKDVRVFAVIDSLFNFGDDGKVTLKDSTKAQEVIDEYYDNFYSLYACDVIFQADLNRDYEIDDLTSDISSKYETLINRFKSFVSQKLTDAKAEKNKDLIEGDEEKELTYTEYADVLKELVDGYNDFDGKLPETTDEDYELKVLYKDLKSYGMKLTYAQVNNGSSFTYQSFGSNLSDVRNDFYKTLYNEIKTNIDSKEALSETVTENDKFTLCADTVFDQDGAHISLVKFNENVSSYLYAAPTADGDGNVPEYNLNAVNENEEVSLDQVAGSLYIALLNKLFTSSTDAKDKYGFNEYPVAYPTTLKMSVFTDTLVSYYTSSNYSNAYFAEKIEGDVYSNYVEIFTYFLNK